MNETEVWKACVKHLEDTGWKIFGTCPPGSTSYIYPACNFTHSVDGVDAPDIACVKNEILLIVECKPSASGLLRPNRHGESDVQKLLRIKCNFLQRDYDEILLKDYNVTAKEVFVGVGYSGPKKMMNEDILHLMVNSDSVVVEYQEALDKAIPVDLTSQNPAS